jgi:hypothetical protein
MASKPIPSYMMPKGSVRQAGVGKSAPAATASAAATARKNPPRAPVRPSAQAVGPSSSSPTRRAPTATASSTPALPPPPPPESASPHPPAPEHSDEGSPVIVSVPRSDASAGGASPRSPAATTPRDEFGDTQTPREGTNELTGGRSIFSSSPVLTPLQELLLKREEKRLALQLLEQDIKRIANDVSIPEKHSRAAELSKRTAALVDKSLEMKTVVQRSRNMDRVLVKIREELDSLDRVLRMKRAEQRQKEATVEIISRRFGEQKAASDELLTRICSILDAVEQHSAAMGAAEQKVAQVRPGMALLELVAFAEAQEALLEETSSGLNELRCIDVGAFDDLLRTQKDAEYRERHATDDHPTNVDEACAQWEVEKEGLIVQYSALARVQKDLQFHIRRGTNIKSTSQLNEFAAHGLVQDVRELRLTLGEIIAANDFTKAEIQELHSRVDVMRHAHETRLNALQCEASLSYSCRIQAEEESAQLVALRDSLHEQLAQSHLLASSVVSHSPAPESAKVREASQPAEHVTPGRSARRQNSLDTSEVRAMIEAAVMEKRPKSLLSRLTTPTKAREACLRFQREEQECLRQHVESVNNSRPVGCRKR